MARGGGETGRSRGEVKVKVKGLGLDLLHGTGQHLALAEWFRARCV